MRGLADGGQHGQLRDTIFPSTSQAYRPLEFVRCLSAWLVLFRPVCIHVSSNSQDELIRCSAQEPYLPETANADNSELVFLRFELIQDEPVINRVVWSVLWISTLISIGLLVTFGVIEKYIHLWDSGFPICNVVRSKCLSVKSLLMCLLCVDYC